MPYPQFDRFKIQTRPLKERENRVDIECVRVEPTARPSTADKAAAEVLDLTAARIREAREAKSPVVIAFGAHTIKNGLGPLLGALAERGWITHLATNGAGVIHDWEFSYQGKTSEHVAPNVAAGTFGNWEETGFMINLAINVGAYRGLGYGESVGALIQDEGLDIPAEDELLRVMAESAITDIDKAAAAADLLGVVRNFSIPAGRMNVPHPYKAQSLQAMCRHLGIPFTAHPMFGHDIIYTHAANCGAAIGRTAQRDFLSFAHAISRLDGGVYLSVGSAVMSPMVFEKSLSMAQNVAMQEGRKIENHTIVVVDLAESDWDWSRGEPPIDSPSYYLRYTKSFSRMGGTMRYLKMDNRDFLLHLWHRLEQ